MIPSLCSSVREGIVNDADIPAVIKGTLNQPLSDTKGTSYICQNYRSRQFWIYAHISMLPFIYIFEIFFITITDILENNIAIKASC